MIHAATIGYQLPGDTEPRETTVSVVQRSEAAAFDQAVEELKVTLINGLIVSGGLDRTRRLDRIRAIVQLRPWAVSYAYTPPVEEPRPLGETITYPTYYHGTK